MITEEMEELYRQKRDCLVRLHEYSHKTLMQNLKEWRREKE